MELQEQADILNSGISTNSLLPNTPWNPSNHGKLSTIEKNSIIKAINELKNSLTSIANTILANNNQIKQTLGDTSANPTLFENTIRQIDNSNSVVEALHHVYTMMDNIMTVTEAQNLSTPTMEILTEYPSDYNVNECFIKQTGENYFFCILTVNGWKSNPLISV